MGSKLTKEQAARLDDAKSAVVIAREIFKTETPDPEQVFGCFERVIEEDDSEQAAEDLKRSIDLAKELFATTSPTTNMIFGTFDAIFFEVEEDDGDEE